jgi:hypothetical protein
MLTVNLLLSKKCGKHQIALLFAFGWREMSAAQKPPLQSSQVNRTISHKVEVIKASPPDPKPASGRLRPLAEPFPPCQGRCARIPEGDLDGLARLNMARVDQRDLDTQL